MNGDVARRGWDAIAVADWETARACFEEARAGGETAEVLDGLGRALHFLGRYPEAIELTERAFAGYRELGRAVDAADCARWLAFLHGTINGNMSVASGWMGRAETLLAAEDECPGHGWLILDHAPFTSDALERERLAASALAIARRFGDTALEYDALALLGEARVASGRVVDGMKLLDQAMTAVVAREVTEVVAVSDILCRLLGACELALDVVRAEEWMSVAGAFEQWSEFVPPVCRSHYGGILVAVGRWPEAEDQLTSALRTFERSYRAMGGAAVVTLADLRLRQGRLEEAAQLLADNDHHPVARRVLATIALVRGELALAEELARLCLSEGRAGPACAPELDLLVQVLVARGNAGEAAGVRDQLAAIAEEAGDERASAFAELAAGRVYAAAGDARASASLQAALARFAAVGFPLEAAKARLELARAIGASAHDAAEREARIALDAFERMGARIDADAAAGFLRDLGSTGRAWPKRYGELTKRENEVLELLAEGCSNEQIAKRLYISRRTAEHHVASILSKLGLRSRAEVAAYVVRAASEDR